MILQEKVKQFTAPRAIFEAVCDNKKSISLRSIDPLTAPPSADPSDYVYSLLSDFYYPIFYPSNGFYTINREEMCERAFGAIMGQLCSKFLEQHQQLKNPRQSRTYKWLKHFAFHNQESKLIDGLVLTWEYMISNKDNIADHQKNVLALIEAIRRKDEAINPRPNK